MLPKVYEKALTCFLFRPVFERAASFLSRSTANAGHGGCTRMTGEYTIHGTSQRRPLHSRASERLNVLVSVRCRGSRAGAGADSYGYRRSESAVGTPMPNRLWTTTFLACWPHEDVLSDTLLARPTSYATYSRCHAILPISAQSQSLSESAVCTRARALFAFSLYCLCCGSCAGSRGGAASAEGVPISRECTGAFTHVNMA